jgi:hypothetical protein
MQRFLPAVRDAIAALDVCDGPEFSALVEQPEMIGMVVAQPEALRLFNQHALSLAI